MRESGGGRSVPLLPDSHRLIHLATCGSTNAEAFARAASGADMPLWVIADRQTAGRGRAGRAWVSEAENFQGSLAFSLSVPPAVAAQLSLVAGVAVLAAIRRAAPAVGGVRLKWPNDVLLGGKKLAGILIESAVLRDGLVAVVGFGINLAVVPGLSAAQATALAAHGAILSPLEMLAFLAEAMHDWLARWQGGAGFADVRQAWLAGAGPLGEPIVVNGGGGRIAGSFDGLDGDGALLMRDSAGARRRVSFGDVEVG